MSISLLSPTTTTTNPLCPYCQSDFLEQMDSPLFNNPNPNSISNPNNNINNPIPNTNPNNLSPESTSFQFPSDDNFLLDSPYLHRLIHHLTNNSDTVGSSPSPSTSHHHSPASKASIEAIPTVKITHTFLSPDPIILCAVCKDQFVIDDETKRLPCTHIYHSDCILPWLSQHNSCPVCRFQMPVEGGGCGDLKGRRRRSRILRMGELMESDEELLGFGSTLRNIARRHRIVFPNGSVRRVRDREGSHNGEEESLFLPTEVRESEVGLGSRDSSVETVSSWPSWAGEGVGGSEVVEGEIGASVSASQGNDDADIVMS